MTKQLSKANDTIDFLNKMVGSKDGKHIKTTEVPGGYDQKEIEFIMESPNGQVENQTLQKFLNEKFE